MRKFVPALLCAISAPAANANSEGREASRISCASVADLDIGCSETARGIVLANSQADADLLRDPLNNAESRFELLFDKKPNAYVTTYGTSEKMFGALNRFKTPDGSIVLFAWPSAEERSRPKQLIDQLSRNVDLTGLTDAEREAKISEMLANIGLPSVEASRQFDLVITPHELGHSLFSRAYWPSHDPATPGEYMSPAPDWFDEGVAQLMEGHGAEGVTAYRLKQIVLFRDAAMKKGLRYVLDLKHPGEKLKSLDPASIPPEGLSDEFLASQGIGSIDEFYALSASLTEFLHARPGSRTIFRDIAVSLSSGMTFEEWLTQRGPLFGLPDKVEELQDLWFAWLDARE